jgi:hypothetical protein
MNVENPDQTLATDGTIDFVIHKTTWIWDVFGSGILKIHYNEPHKQPSLRVRILSRIFLGSTWEKK